MFLCAPGVVVPVAEGATVSATKAETELSEAQSPCASIAREDVEVRTDETTIDRAAMERLAKALVFICRADHPTTIALQAAAESGSERDIKNARALFLRLKPSDRRAALTMLVD